jgi:hypothetical protein
VNSDFFAQLDIVKSQIISNYYITSVVSLLMAFQGWKYYILIRKEVKKMKTLVVMLSIVSLLLLPLAAYTQSLETEAITSSGGNIAAPPPVSQPLIREGDFAIKLASTLNLGMASNDADAETILASAGIAPKNGWISDYPVTLVVIGELQQSIEVAASAGRLSMGSSAALQAFQALVADEGLPIQAAAGTSPAAEAATNYGEYSNPTVINNYYYEEGPPVVTYYAPPSDYAYLYAWIPYPFWWAGFWFPGYYCLNDFDVVLFVHHEREVCTNHFYNRATRSYVRIDPRTLGFERVVHGRREFASRQWREHAGSIYRQNLERFRTRNGAHLSGSAPFSRAERMQRPQASNHFARRSGERRFQSLPNHPMVTPGERTFHGSERSFRNFHSPSMAGRSEGFHGGSQGRFHAGFGGRSFGGFHSGGGFHGGGFRGGFGHARG